MIEAVGKIITDNEDLKIDVKKLRDEGASLKVRMQEIVRSIQDQQQQADHQVTQEQQQQQKSIYG
jgi:regulator of replication initiation timing